MSEKAPFMVFSGTNSRYLAEKICASLNCPLGKMNITHFADGEFAVSYEESIRGANVFLVQSTFPNSDNLMELLLMVDAAKRGARAYTPFQARLRPAAGRGSDALWCRRARQAFSAFLHSGQYQQRLCTRKRSLL